MKPRLLSCIISIFLSGAFSAEAQSLALEAVEYERVIFEGAAPAVVNEAILSRAECLVKLERWSDASATLERLRMYAMNGEQREQSAYLKALCQYRLGNYEAAAAVLSENPVSLADDRTRLRALVLAANRDYDAALECARNLTSDNAAVEDLFRHTPKYKSAEKAMFLSIIPTAGHIYVERPDMWWTTVGSVASAAFAVYEAISGNWLTAVLGGSLLVNCFYIEEHLRPVQKAAVDYNSTELEAFLWKLENTL